MCPFMSLLTLVYDTPSDGTLLGRTSEEIFVMLVVVVLHFIFDLHFICRFPSFTIHLLFDIILHPSVDYRRVFTSMLYFQLSPSQSDLRHFHFQPFYYLLTASATVLSGRFLPTGLFHLKLLHWHF